LLALVLLATLAAPLLLSGWIFSLRGLRPDFNRLNLLRGLKNIVSGHSLVELIKALGKCVLLGGIGVWAVVHGWGDMQQLPTEGANGAISHLGRLVATALFALVGGLIVIAGIDVPYQLLH